MVAGLLLILVERNTICAARRGVEKAMPTFQKISHYDIQRCLTGTHDRTPGDR